MIEFLECVRCGALVAGDRPSPFGCAKGGKHLVTAKKLPGRRWEDDDFTSQGTTNEPYIRSTTGRPYYSERQGDPARAYADALEHERRMMTDVLYRRKHDTDAANAQWAAQSAESKARAEDAAEKLRWQMTHDQAGYTLEQLRRNMDRYR